MSGGQRAISNVTSANIHELRMSQCGREFAEITYSKKSSQVCLETSQVPAVQEQSRPLLDTSDTAAEPGLGRALHHLGLGKK